MADVALFVAFAGVFTLGVFVGALLVYTDELRGYKRRRKGFVNVREIR